jgi:sorbitol-specific phosphotransferase system component IIA
MLSIVVLAASLIGCDSIDTRPSEAEALASVQTDHALAATTAAGVIFDYNEREESPAITVACNGELVEGFATWHYRGSLRQDQTGTLHFKGHVNSHFAGTGTETGARYTGAYTDNYSERFAFGELPFVYTGTYTRHLNGQGQVSNTRIHEVWHLTVNANGDVTADIDAWQVDCS